MADAQEELDGQVKACAERWGLVLDELRHAVVGQQVLLERLAIALLADGHMLLEGVPGLAKTLSISALAQVLEAKFSRIQFTPDLLPADVLGTSIYDAKKGRFATKEGPVFANLLLADEINRAPAKVQSALLEAMQERQVTIGGETLPLPQPFLVMATQNPIEQEGTYPLPEAQLDRFLLKVKVAYPSRQEELEIIDRYSTGRKPILEKVATLALVAEGRGLVHQIHVADKIKKYVVELVWATRAPREAALPDLADLIAFGASPRASLALVLAAKAQAFLRKRSYVLPEDVKAVAPDVLRHRVLLSYEAEADEVSVDEVIKRLLAGVRVP